MWKRWRKQQGVSKVLTISPLGLGDFVVFVYFYDVNVSVIADCKLLM